MANSAYSSTEETTNACRACRLLLGPCTDELRDVLLHHVPLSTFPHVIKRKMCNLPRLTVPQLNLILPRGSTYTGNYNDMDIPLLYILLRNICGIPPHTNGWGNDPDPTERSLSANIERLRIARNQCVHSSSPVLSNADFNTIWSTIKSAVIELDSFLNNGNQYEKEVDFLRHETMDPVRDLHYIEELRKQAEDDAATREMVHNLKRKLEKYDTENQNKFLKIEDTISKAAVPFNVKEINEGDILRWKEDDKLFHESHNFRAMLEKAKKETHVMFVGVPGSGKTATARHIALMLQQEGYEIVPIKDIRKIEDYCDPNNPQVFVIDDVVGVFGLQDTKLNLFCDYQERIKIPVVRESKTLMTCREALYRKAIEMISSFGDRNNTVFFHSEANALTNDDKMQMLKKYNIDVNLLSHASLTTASKMFPYLCRLFSEEKKFQRYGFKFFNNPVPCILKQLEEMKRQNKVHYVSLVLCMMNNNKISEKMLQETERRPSIENLNGMKCSVLQKSKVSSQTDNFQLIDALYEMQGTYTMFSGNEYTFIHDSMFEIVAYHFGSQFPELILQYLGSTYIANFVKTHEGKGRNHNQVNENRQPSESPSNISGEGKNDEHAASSPEIIDSIIVSNKTSKVNEIASINEKREDEKVKKKYEENQKKENIVVNENVEIVEFFDLCIRLREDQYFILAERLIRDVEHMELYDVFTNDVLKQPKVCQTFIEVLIKMPYTELKALFLSQREDVSKIMRRKIEGKCKTMDEWKKHQMLANGSLGKQGCFARVINWVIYYGHNEILKYIIEQTERHKETQSQLFGKQSNLIGKSLFQEKEINQHSVEQYRLLVLSCYSGDFKTFKMVLKYVNRKIINEPLTSFWPYEMWNDTPLTAACVGGHLHIVKELISAGADVEQLGGDKTPLIAACTGGLTRVVVELLKSKADVNNNFNEWGDTPLIAACEGGHMTILKELLKAGADVNQVSAFNSPLTVACNDEHIDMVKELLNAGADVNLKVDESPLFIACKRGHESMVTKLIAAGANVNLQDKYQMPLTAAIDGGYMSIVKKLLEAGADVNLQSKYPAPFAKVCAGENVSLVKELLRAGANVNLKGDFITPLNAACTSGSVSVVEVLINAGAEVNPKDDHITPLTAACKRGVVCIVEELLKAGANVNPPDSFASPLSAACKTGKISVVKQLLKAGANVNQQDKHTTPLIEACENGHFSIMKELLESGADVNPKGYYTTPLIAASKGGHTIALKRILDAGADVNLQDNHHSPLTAACEGGHVNVVKEILKAGADVNLQDNHHTPLTAACEGGHENVVKEILKVGADINLQDKHNTPLIAACKVGHINVMKDLIKAGADVNLQDTNNTPLTAAIIGKRIGELNEQNAELDISRRGTSTTKRTTTFTHGHLSVLKGLLSAGAKVNKQDRYYTPLTAACTCGNIDNVNEILKAGADVNLQDKYNTPLSSACKGGHMRVVERLIDAGADVNKQDQQNTPLVVACQAGYKCVVKKLLGKGAAVNLLGKDYTPLSAASKGGHLDVVKELLGAGADVNLLSKCAALTLACEGGHKSVVEELLDAGAEINPQKEYTKPLTAACAGGHMSIVKLLLHKGADVNPKDPHDTELTIACKHGNIVKVRTLLNEGADVNPQGCNTTPLTAACKGGHKSIVKELLNAGANISPLGEYNTPLTVASNGGYVNIVKELLKAGADINPQGKYTTPLTAAFKSGHISVIKELLESGGILCPQGYHTTPLVAACTNGHMSVIKQLLTSGANVNLPDQLVTPLICACMSGRIKIVQQLIDAGADVNQQDHYNTPLIAACEAGHMNVVKKLLDTGADVNPNGTKLTPLIAAIMGKRIQRQMCEVLFSVNIGSTTNIDVGHELVVKELLVAGADVNLQGQNYTPLTAACTCGEINTVKEILEAGADVNMQDKCNTPLTAVCALGHLNIVKVLLEAGADVNQRDQKNTSLIVACRNCHLYVIGELLEAGAEVNLLDKEDISPLIAACEGGHISAVEKLLEAGADVNLQGKCTALTAACETGHLNIVKKLIAVGANVNPQEEFTTPLSAACAGGHIGIVKLLVEKGADVNPQDEDDSSCRIYLSDIDHKLIYEFRSPFKAAFAGNHMDVIKVLAEAGAELSLF